MERSHENTSTCREKNAPKIPGERNPVPAEEISVLFSSKNIQN